MIILYIFGTWAFMHFLHPFNFSSEIVENIASVPAGVGVYFSAILTGVIPPKRRGDMIYFPLAANMGSVANYFSSKGRKWTNASQLFRFSKINQYRENINLDNFIYTPLVSRNLPLLSLKQLYNNKPIHAPIVASGRSGVDLIEGVIVLGSAGGGKSQFLLNLFNQNKFNRAIVHDAKGEFIKYFYRDDRDIIFNTYDSRGAVWDIFAEAEKSPVAIKLFFDSYIENYMDKDFWSNSAVLKYKKVFSDVMEMPISSREKWKIYNESISDMITSYQEGDSRAKNSLALVMEMIQEHFISQEKQLERGARTFTINDFKDDADIRLFLSNRAEFKSELTPYFTAFLSVMTVILSSKDDTKTDITLLMLDEYLSFVQGLREDTLTTLHTTLRSRGVMIVTAMQSLPQDPEKKALVWGNNRYFIIYPIIDENTQKTVNSLVGQTIYSEKSESQNIEGRKSASENFKSSSADAIENLNYTTIGGANYAHITFVPTPNILYIGRNDLFKKEEIAEAFIKVI
jgi:hypothetical protein